MSTLREIHERCKARHEPWTGSAQKVGGKPMCVGCDLPWPCPDYSDAEAALAILNDSTIVGGPGAPKRRKSHRLIPDSPVSS